MEDISDDKNFRWQETKRMAAELGIPIVVIDGSQCAKLEYDKILEMIKRVKEEKKMDLIPEIIHKIENNRACPRGVLKKIRNELFSNEKINLWLEEIIGAIITSNIDDFNKGIEKFIQVTNEVKSYYEGESFDVDECKTYDYDEYLDRLNVLFNSRNESSGNQVREKVIEREEDNRYLK